MNVFFPRSTNRRSAGPSGGRDRGVGGHRAVLLVEDEDAVRGVATLALTLRGYRVMAAGSGPAALRLLEFVHDRAPARH